jgi:hypothetical protein
VDKDGALLVLTFRGVWFNAEGRYFIKIDGKAVTRESEPADESALVQWFLSAEKAACHHDEMTKTNPDNTNIELNFKEDGSRNIYEDTDTLSNIGPSLDALGGGAMSVVPALSIINIKVSVSGNFTILNLADNLL